METLQGTAGLRTSIPPPPGASHKQPRACWQELQLTANSRAVCAHDPGLPCRPLPIVPLPSAHLVRVPRSPSSFPFSVLRSSPLDDLLPGPSAAWPPAPLVQPCLTPASMNPVNTLLTGSPSTEDKRLLNQALLPSPPSSAAFHYVPQAKVKWNFILFLKLPRALRKDPKL